MQGFGTVVTGTLMDGNIRIGDDVMIYPDGIKAKVRGIQTYGKDTEIAVAGQRTAINLPTAKRRPKELPTKKLLSGLNPSLNGRNRAAVNGEPPAHSKMLT